MKRIAIRWIDRYGGTANDLKNGKSNVTGFANAFFGSTVSNLGDELALPQDFLPAEESGKTNENSIECAEIAYFSGHGNPQNLCFPQRNVHCSETQLGHAGQLTWLIVDAEEVLNSQNIFERWANADVFRGLEAIFGFHGSRTDAPDRGQRFAQHLQEGDSPELAWVRACTETEPQSTECAWIMATYPSAQPNEQPTLAQTHLKTPLIAPNPEKPLENAHPLCPECFTYMKTHC